MLAPKFLRKPLNWQDFETLCKKLWGEIWECREVKKNGRSGQSQNGVDVFGVPLGEIQCYGIQCKGKDEYSGKQFSEQEILKEIKKAKEFKPALKKLYFATTANKDVRIEEFIRIQNQEHMEQGLFEVHLFSWEDIAELIEENRQTYQYYVESQNFKDTTSVEFTFGNGKASITLTPKFRQNRTIFRREIKMDIIPGMNSIAAAIAAGAAYNKLFQPKITVFMKKPTVNHSYVKFSLLLRNTGSEALEDYKLFFSLHGDVLDLNKTNVKDDTHAIISLHPVSTTTFLDAEQKTGELTPRNNIMVGDDSFQSADIYLKTPPEKQDISLQWKLISKRFKSGGELMIHILPQISYANKEVIVEQEADERIESGKIEDFIADKE